MVILLTPPTLCESGRDGAPDRGHSLCKGPEGEKLDGWRVERKADG